MEPRPGGPTTKHSPARKCWDIDPQSSLWQVEEDNTGKDRDGAKARRADHQT